MRAIGITALAALASTCSAQTWNTYSDFSATSNPNGVWSYGWAPTLTGAFTVYTLPWSYSTVMPAWTAVPFENSGPFVAINPTAGIVGVSGTDIQVPPQTAWFHPGLGGNEVSAYRWTAPANGQYTVSAAFAKIDLGNSIQHQGNVRVAGQTVFTQPIDISGAPTTFSATTYSLSTGQTVDFIISVISSSAGGAYAINGTVVRAGCYANCDNSTSPPILNANDFQCFLNAYASGSSYANCDQSTSPPILNANDFQCFLNAFAAGCP